MRWTVVPFGLLVIGLLLVAAPRLGPAPAGANPPGNNGTVKVDGLAFDDHPDNEPHPGCTFQVDFYGFDEGDLSADVSFEAVPPTGQGQLLADVVFIGEDDNSGGGSEAGLDASRTYNLTDALQGFAAQPQQGFHIKLTIHAEGAQGADTKYKVFWVGACLPSPTPTLPPGPNPSPSPCPTLPPTATLPPGATLPPTDTEVFGVFDPRALQPQPPLGAAASYAVPQFNPCTPGPTPVIPESPFPLLLPLSAAGLAIVALVLVRRRERRARAPTAEGRAEY